MSRLTTVAFTVFGQWDAAADFPRAPRPENPAHDKYGNTTWSYLYSNEPTREPTLYRPLPQFHVRDTQLEQWVVGLRPDGTVDTPLVGVLATEMVFHPDRNQFAILGWRSPYTGRISVEFRLRFPDPAGQAKSNGVMWSIDRGNSSLQRELLTPMAVAQPSMPLDINQGDTLYLVIEDAGDADFDSTVGTLRIRTLH